MPPNVPEHISAPVFLYAGQIYFLKYYAVQRYNASAVLGFARIKLHNLFL